MTWREEQRRLNAFLQRKKFLPGVGTAVRVKRKRKKRRASEKVIRWQQRHRRTYARRMRAWRAWRARRKRREEVLSGKASAQCSVGKFGAAAALDSK